MPEEGTSRRNFLKFGAGAAVGAVAATFVPEIGRKNEQQERKEFYDTIKSITYEDLNNPESQKIRGFTRKCASEYIKVTGLEIGLEELVDKTKIYRTKDEYFEGIRASGVNPPDSERPFGTTTFNDNTVHMNLELIREGNTSMETEYPGVMLFKQLCHEWGDVLSIDNRNGEQLGQDNNTFGDREGNNLQVWERYRGGVIYSKDYRALSLFGNAWNELTTRRVVMESLKGDETLLSAATTLSSDSAYREATDKLSRVIERADLNVQEMAYLHQNSNVEGMFQRMGSAFDDSVVDTLSQGVIQGRTEDQIRIDRDFLVGRTVAWSITNENWQDYRALINHIKPRE